MTTQAPAQTACMARSALFSPSSTVTISGVELPNGWSDLALGTGSGAGGD